MGQLIKQFLDGSFLEYDRGKFDSWCIYFTKSNGNRCPPRDVDYFNELKSFAGVYGIQKVYDDYVRVYDMTGASVDRDVLNSISTIANSYGKDALQIDVIFSILYMGMIAEERKANTKLGKRIKRLGVYVLLIEGRNVSDAANFMRGMEWRDIDRLCQERGF